MGRFGGGNETDAPKIISIRAAIARFFLLERALERDREQTEARARAHFSRERNSTEDAQLERVPADCWAKCSLATVAEIVARIKAADPLDGTYCTRAGTRNT